MIRHEEIQRPLARSVLALIHRGITLHPSPEDAASVIKGTRVGVLVTALNALVYAVAAAGSGNSAFIALWLAVIFALSVTLVRMSAKASRRQITRVSSKGARRLVLTSVLLAAPWAALPLHVVAFHGAGDAMIVLLVCTGMLSGGAFMLHRAFVAAIGYMLTILIAIIFSFQFGDWDMAWPVTTYGILYGGYLAYFAYTAGETARQRDASVAALSEAVAGLQEARDENHRLATLDFLTGLPNRKAFSDELQAAAIRQKERGEPFTLLLVDLDRFKNVNDLYGHGVGDELLAEMARRLRQSLEREDVIGRIGGDEFAVILMGVSDTDVIRARIGRILKELNRPAPLAGRIIHAGASIGAVICPDDGLDPTDLLLKGDLALNRAKEAGRGRWMQFGAHLQRRAIEDDSIEEGLRTALAARSLHVLYQPQIALADGLLIGAEALVRWPPGTGLAPSPERFLAVASERGLLPALSRQIAEMVAGDIETWRRQGLSPVKIALNLHPDDLKSPELLIETIDMFEARDITGRHLTMEITEDCLVGRGKDGAATVLDVLVERGYDLSFDDFGTGQASLSHLRKVPVREIKIDRSFVWGLTDQREDRAIVAAIAEIARGMGLRSVAEGVETDVQRRILTDLGIDAAQGFLWSRPISAARLATMFGLSQRSACAG
ncbi:putative bifunctional diguanylate cyclase/phosphodiesterase [Cereibacter sphaeroides]|uniref:putative bifunctional diguanylate cyclase/phosphodiesterase n=1 Tax=Cereibacter sphaeroides TaxID=1063 RepID=UPI001F2C3F67|nr:EAL domain-containing protein [Cereibacter sphaeroides]MCE6967290.1 EAL domain-containing protein [Cereibacter sphaeroides]